MKNVFLFLLLVPFLWLIGLYLYSLIPDDPPATCVVEHLEMGRIIYISVKQHNQTTYHVFVCNKLCPIQGSSFPCLLKK